jgi:predicted transcriptional regulator
MFSRKIINSILKPFSCNGNHNVSMTKIVKRNYNSDKKVSDAMQIFEKSCYFKVDCKINENASVKEAITKFTVFDIGCLAVTDNNDKVIGVCSQRDYINKIACLDKIPESCKVKDICTYQPNIIIARTDDTLEACMNKLMFKKTNHLLIFNDKTKDDFVGIISIKDIVQEVIKNKTEIITRLSDFKVGKGAFFGSE